uniref:Uncharacterized protein n=1 Tax=Globodera pallida TaxID=36090 RepID=A0A183CQ68_GLOPA
MSAYQLSLITPKSFQKKVRQIGMKLNAFVLIVLAVLALSAICNAGKKKPVQVIHVKVGDFKEAVNQHTVDDNVIKARIAREKASSGGESSKMNARPPNQTESCGSNNTALKRSSLADDASSSPSSTNPPGHASKKPKSGKKN